MNIILLSGGSGKRLWPLSNDIRSKQFIKIFKTAELEKKLAYDGIDTGSGRFAPGNEIEIKNQKTGDAKIVLNEKRDEMKTAEKKQKENDSLGR